ncbi:MAG: glycosyltransferase [Lachnospiraceae bacterium]|nr:glycosyltransferase [Lachnospiraceae bacterium]
MHNYSVLMAVYHKEKPEYFKLSIESMLNQTVKTDDFVIVCDGKLTDELDEVIDFFTKQYRDLFNIVRKEKCEGLGKALNLGITCCKNEIIARMDSDDIAKSNRMENQLEIYESMDVDMVGASVEEFADTTDNIIAIRKLPKEHDEIYKFAKKRNPFNHPCMTFKKTAVLEAGSYMDYPLFEDYYLWARMLMKGFKGYNIEESLLYMRSGESMYLRRGGIDYTKKMWKFKTKLYKDGFYSFKDYLISVSIHTVVSLMPNGLRKTFYKKVLRRR